MTMNMIHSTKYAVGRAMIKLSFAPIGVIVAAQGASPRLPGLRLVVVVKRKKYCGKKAA